MASHRVPCRSEPDRDAAEVRTLTSAYLSQYGRSKHLGKFTQPSDMAAKVASNTPPLETCSARRRRLAPRVATAEWRSSPAQPLDPTSRGKCVHDPLRGMQQRQNELAIARNARREQELQQKSKDLEEKAIADRRALRAKERERRYETRYQQDVDAARRRLDQESELFELDMQHQVKSRQEARIHQRLDEQLQRLQEQRRSMTLSRTNARMAGSDDDRQTGLLPLANDAVPELYAATFSMWRHMYIIATRRAARATCHYISRVSRRVWVAWVTQTQASLSERFARQDEDRLRAHHPLLEMAVVLHRTRILTNCFRRWLAWQSLRERLRVVEAEHSERQARMRQLLQSLSESNSRRQEFCPSSSTLDSEKSYRATDLDALNCPCGSTAQGRDPECAATLQRDGANRSTSLIQPFDSLITTTNSEEAPHRLALSAMLGLTWRKQSSTGGSSTVELLGMRKPSSDLGPGDHEAVTEQSDQALECIPSLHSPAIEANDDEASSPKLTFPQSVSNDKYVRHDLAQSIPGEAHDENTSAKRTPRTAQPEGGRRRRDRIAPSTTRAMENSSDDSHTCAAGKAVSPAGDCYIRLMQRAKDRRQRRDDLRRRYNDAQQAAAEAARAEELRAAELHADHMRQRTAEKRAAREAREKRQAQISLFKARFQLAALHDRRTRIVSFGWRPWIKLVRCARDRLISAQNHSSRSIVRPCFSAWTGWVTRQRAFSCCAEGIFVILSRQLQHRFVMRRGLARFRTRARAEALALSAARKVFALKFVKYIWQRWIALVCAGREKASAEYLKLETIACHYHTKCEFRSRFKEWKLYVDECHFQDEVASYKSQLWAKVETWLKQPQQHP